MIGPAYASRAVQAVLGPSRSQLIPATLWLGWLDSTGAVITVTTTSLSHDIWEPTATGVTNHDPIDAGPAEAGWVIHAVGLFDSPTGDIVASAALPEPVSPAEGDLLVFAPGGLVFEA